MIPVLTAALDQVISDSILLKSDIWAVESVPTEQAFEESMDRILATPYGLILCGSLFGTDFMNEFAQVMRQQGPDLQIISISADNSDFQSASFIKNGFSEAYKWPMDQSILQERLEEIAKIGLGSRVFKSIFVSDLDASSEIPFETFVHLPLNRKYIRFSGKNSSFGQNRFNRLRDKDFGKLYIEKSEANNFYVYMSKKLKAKEGHKGISETESREKVSQTIRSLFSELFDQSEGSSFETGKSFLADAQKIVSQYITNGRSSNWYAQMVMTLGSGLNSYDHASTVSTICALIAIGISHSSPEDLAIAAFFHDLGRATLPDDIAHRSMDELSPQEKEEYRKHPIESVNILKSRRVIINSTVEKAILQHHERFDGNGFPREIKGGRISEEAQILSFADQFSYMTTDQDGKERLPADEVFRRISSNGSIGPALLFKLQKLFTRDSG